MFEIDILFNHLFTHQFSVVVLKIYVLSNP